MKNNLLTISELAYFSRVSRDTLLYYDRIGLIKPTLRAANNYRYYSGDQIGIANLIRTYQSFGYTLNDIRDLMKRRSPQLFLDKYDETLLRINLEIEQLERSRVVLNTLHAMVEGAMSVEEDQITYGYHPAEPILLGPQIDYSDGKSDYDGLMEFYEFCKKWDPHMNLNWSAWGLFNGERIVRGDWRYPDRYYFNRPSSPDKKPAGYYVTAYTRGNYGQTANLYERILAFIKKNGLTVVGNCFEAYVLNEIVLPDPQHYLIRASLQVDERDLGTAK